MSYSLRLALDFRDPPAVTRLTVHCWLHIPAQSDRLPGCLKHLWNKWMFNLDLLWRCLVESLAVRNSPGYLSYEATCKWALYSIDLRRSREYKEMAGGPLKEDRSRYEMDYVPVRKNENISFFEHRGGIIRHG